MLRQASNNPDVLIRSLYDLYPDFNIEVQAEQQSLEQAELLILQHQLYWYSCPPRLKLWIDKVFTQGWAYGKGATALKGKNLLWAVTTGVEHDQFDMGDHPRVFGAYPTPACDRDLLPDAQADACGCPRCFQRCPSTLLSHCPWAAGHWSNWALVATKPANERIDSVA